MQKFKNKMKRKYKCFFINRKIEQRNVIFLYVHLESIPAISKWSSLTMDLIPPHS